MPSEVDYCPFCGARLSMDESLEAHLDDYDECASSYAEWTGGGSQRKTAATRDPATSRGKAVVTWLIIAVVMTYALVIQGSVLLGVIASALVYAVAHVDWRGLAT
jgi:hypothetical protein